MADAKRPDPITAQLMETYLAQRDALKRFLKTRTGNDDIAEDLLQEMFFRLERVATAEHVQSASAYLYKMALNLAHDYRRERLRTQTRDGQWAESNRVLMGGEPIADIPSVEDAYDAKQRLSAIVDALNDLSPQCRKVFILHKFESLSHAEISAQIGISRSTVEKHMATALKHLVRRLH